MKYKLTVEQADRARKLYIRIKVVALGEFELTDDDIDAREAVNELYDEQVDALESYMEDLGIPSANVRNSMLWREGDECYLEVPDGAIEDSFDA